jgi:hypothetical protein
MSVWNRVIAHFVPSRANAYRPHLLGKPWLLFFLAFVVAVEGFLVADLAVQQSGQVFLAAVVVAQPVTQSQSEARSLTQSFERQYSRLLEDPQPPVEGALGTMALLLVGLVALAFFVHLDIQPAAMLASGLLVAAMAASFFFLNERLLGPGINSLHESEASATLAP